MCLSSGTLNCNCLFLQGDHKMVMEKKMYFSFSLINCGEACSGMTSETCYSSAAFSD